MTKREIRRFVLDAGSENAAPTAYGGEEKEEGIYLMQHYMEYTEFLYYMYHNYDGFDLTMSIGIGGGGEVKLFRDFIACDRTIIIDNGSYPTFKHWPKVKPQVDSDIDEYIDDSLNYNLRDRLNKKYGGQLEYAFIDGDHTTPHTIGDINLAKRLCKDNCIIALHDIYLCSGPKDAHRILGDSGDILLWETSEFKRYGISVWQVGKKGLVV